MAFYALTVFLSAFLLFQVQPMIAKAILPWFGGSSHVWTTCMLFFQVALLGGYAYAHLIVMRLAPIRQWILQSALLAAAVFYLPILPHVGLRPEGGEQPTTQIFWLLLISLGLPYFALASTAPLIQAWQNRSHPWRSPFRLYALSNVGSLLALLSYPFVVEWLLPLGVQSTIWTWAFVLYAVLCSVSGYLSFRRANSVNEHHSDAGTTGVHESAANAGAGQSKPRAKVERRSASKATRFAGPPTLLRQALWILLPMAASIILLATTNLMTQEVAAVPFLWVVPLSLYLISFIICFDQPKWYQRALFYPLFAGSAILSSMLAVAGPEAGLPLQIVGYSAVCFFTAMICHGELARLKPDPRYLTAFYLMLAVGGAAGGVTVAIVSPAIFNDFYEFPLGLLLATVLVFGIFMRESLQRGDFRKVANADYGTRSSSKRAGADGSQHQSLSSEAGPLAVPRFRDRLSGSMQILGFVLTLIGGPVVAGVVVSMLWRIQTDEDEIIFKQRSPYGVLTVKDYESSRSLLNGRIKHGWQYTRDPWSGQPTSYYGPSSGAGLAMHYHFDQTLGMMFDAGGVKVGVIGLGVGTMAAWGRPNDHIRFYELDPLVETVAERYFTFLRDSKATVDVELGDARINLERELERGEAQGFNVLIVDAFCSDSIPMHLLTREAFAIYREHLAEDGILAVHISNRFLDLGPVVYHAAAANDMDAVLIDDKPVTDQFNSTSWVLIAPNPYVLQSPAIAAAATPWPDPVPEVHWTDDYGSLLPILEWDWTIN